MLRCYSESMTNTPALSGESPAQEVAATTNACEVKLEITFDVNPADWGVSRDRIRHEVANRVELILSTQLRELGLINRMSTVLA